MVTAEAPEPISLNDIETQANKLLSQAPVVLSKTLPTQIVPPEQLEIFHLFATQRLARKVGRRDYPTILGEGSWSPNQTNTDFGRIGVVRELLKPREKFDPLANYYVTTLTADWKNDQEQASWSLKIVENERDYLPELTNVTIISQKGSARFTPEALQR